MRPTNWSVLGLDGDPTPGDPDIVRRAGSQVSDMATIVETAQTDLGSVVGQVDHAVWAGASGDAFRSTAGDRLKPALGLVSDSLSGAASALTTWANDIEDAQRQADHLLSQATSAAADMSAASGGLGPISDTIDRVQRALDAADPGSDAARTAQRQLTDARAQQSATSATVIAASHRLDAAIGSIAAVADDYTTKAARAATALHRSVEDTQPPKPKPKPGFWQNLGNGTLDVLSTVGNGVASFGNAMVQHPDETTGLLLGLLTMAGGDAIEGGGVALDATGVGAIGGVPLNIIGAGVIAAGGTATAAASTSLMQHAMGDSATSPLQTDRVSESNATKPKDPAESEVGQNAEKQHGVDRGDGRDDYGQFVSKKAYDGAKDKEGTGLDNYEVETGDPVIRTQIKATREGDDHGRFYDGLVKNPDGTYTGIEIKSGGAVRNAQQRTFDEGVSTSPATATLPNGDKITIVRVLVRTVP